LCRASHTLEELFLEFSLCDFNLDSLVDLLVVATFVVGVVLDGCGEEGVDKGGLSESRLAGDLVESATAVVLPFRMAHTMIVNAAPRFATILCLLQC
jgi:hypothetical protein